jgi:hypothetical protein
MKVSSGNVFADPVSPMPSNSIPGCAWRWRLIDFSITPVDPVRGRTGIFLQSTDSVGAQALQASRVLRRTADGLYHGLRQRHRDPYSRSEESRILVEARLVLTDFIRPSAGFESLSLRQLPFSARLRSSQIREEAYKKRACFPHAASPDVLMFLPSVNT